MKTTAHDIGIENHINPNDPDGTYARCDAAPGEIRKAIRHLMTHPDYETSPGIDAYYHRMRATDHRSARGHIIIGAVIEALIKDCGYSLREATDTIVLDAVREAAKVEKSGVPS